MSKQSELTLKSLCSRPGTYSSAKELLSMAMTRTGPGSGHHLGQGAVGLPAICAYLASQREGNNDISESIAQKASCLGPRIFKSTLNIVRAALKDYLRPSCAITFRTLAQKKGVNDDAIKWMEEVDTTLRRNGEVQTDNFEPDSRVVQAMIFYWVCDRLRMHQVNSSDFKTQHGITPTDFRNLMRAIDDDCSNLRMKIDQHAGKRLSAPSTPATSPSKSSAKSRTSPRTTTPLKRKAIAAEIPDFLSPTKKQKVYSPSKLRQAVAASDLNDEDRGLTEMFPSRPLDASSSRSSEDALDVHMELSRGSLPQTPTRRSSVRTAAGPSTYINPSSFYSSSQSTRSRAKSYASSAGDQLETEEALDTMTPSRSHSSRSSSRLRPPDNESDHTESPRERAFWSAPRSGSSTRAYDVWPSSGAESRSNTDYEDYNTSDADYDMTVADQAADEEHEREPTEEPLRCRHVHNPFSDRIWWDPRDADRLKEEELCEKQMANLVERWGYPEALKELLV